MAVSKDYEFKKGDKIRIVNVNAILGGCRFWNNRDITECVGHYRGNVVKPLFASTKNKSESLFIDLSEWDAIELVPAFKVGDVVKVVANTANHHFPIGEHVRITAVGKGGCDAEYLCGTDYWGVHFSDIRKIETKEPTKPKKAERIAELARQVAELNEIMAKLERNEAEEEPKIPQLTPNQERKAIIAEAKDFVDWATTKSNDGIDATEGNHIFQDRRTKVYFTVNAEKRTVVAVAVGAYNPVLYGKAVAKCSDGDVFNVDIGKAIAVARLFALDFERFANAVQPSDVAVGMVVRDKVFSTLYTVRKINSDITERKHGTAFNVVERSGWLGEKQVTITDDTDAQYAD